MRDLEKNARGFAQDAALCGADFEGALGLLEGMVLSSPNRELAGRAWAAFEPAARAEWQRLCLAPGAGGGSRA